VPLPPHRGDDVLVEASFLAVLRRLVRWLHAIAYYATQRARHRLRGRHDDPTVRGRLLRQTLERMGGTFVKLGQQLSTRLDLLPFETCEELARMLDATPPFPTDEAIAAVERATGKPLAATFAAFDPEPLGSASVACVYHAVLHGGEEVAVKVRRPGIAALFAADLATLDLLCRAAELLTLVRPGFTRAVRTELRTMLTEELDFRREARYQALFRRNARRDGQPVTAPRVHWEHCGDDVIVSEFVRGVWMQDLVVARERRDRDALAYCARLGIDPTTVAKRLLHALYWANFENLFYHADPHPANVVVRPGGELVFLDFGACGPTLHRNRRNYVELFRRQARRDIQGMVQVFGNIISPLPPIDEHALHRRGEALTARWQYGFESEHPEWWERSSAGMWIGMLELTRAFDIPVTIDTVRLVRSSLLYDTIAARLSGTIDMQREFDRYRRAARRRALEREWRGTQPDRPGSDLLASLDRTATWLGDQHHRVAEFAHGPMVFTRPAASTQATAAGASLRLVVASVLLTAFGMATAGTPSDAGLHGALDHTLASPWYWTALLLVIAHGYRGMRLAVETP
jgi:ubiquinone biosynthesis protein